MAKVIAYLKEYQVLPKVMNMRPFGHLFIMYQLQNSDEEVRVFRAGPRRGYLHAFDTLERTSIDSNKRITAKKPICILRKHIPLYVQKPSYEEKLLAWFRFTEYTMNLKKEINDSKTPYGIIRNNSNSVAGFVWRYIANQDISSACEKSVYNFIGHSSFTNDLHTSEKNGA